jgi:eukaryotic-like serine/threonine-protein kinase
MTKSLWKKDWFVGLLLMLLFLLLANTRFIQSIEWQAYDLGLRFSSVKPANKDIVVVAIDDRSLQTYGAWPWPRTLLAEATRKLARTRPDVIGFTVPFDVPQNNRSLDQIEKLKQALTNAGAMRGKVRKAFRATQSTLLADQVLASRFRTSGRIVLAIPYGKDFSQKSGPSGPLPEYLNKFTLQDVNKNTPEKHWLPLFKQDPVPEADIVYPPIEALSKEVGGAGVIYLGGDNPDAARRQPLIVHYADHYLPSFALMLAVRHQRMATSRISATLGDSLLLDGKKLQTDHQLHIYPRYYKQKKNKPAFKVYSMADILEDQLDNSSLRGKIVIVGVTSRQHARPVMTPIGEAMSPTVVIAHTVSSLLNEELYKAPDWTTLIQALAVIMVGLYLMFIFPRLRTGTAFVISLLIIIALFNAHFFFMISESTWIPLMTALLTLITGHLFIGLKQVIENRADLFYGELSEANHQLGQSFQSQGQLDQAFEKYRSCRMDQTLLHQLYNLGLDYERKRQFNKAVSVFEFIAQHDNEFRDVADRITRNSEASTAVVLNGANSSGNKTNLFLGKSGLQKPMLGRYQIDSEIGRGAMGTVYLGHDPRISRTVAIKTLSLAEEFENGQVEEVKSRFFREAEAAGRLNHPNIVTIYDIGEDQDLAYIAMDYLKGKNLSLYCKKDNLLSDEKVLNVIIQVAKALDYAHLNHVVHRDIKPANIIYDETTGKPTVTDFGVACLTDSSKTKTGTVLGSPYYMSPEQLAGSKVDGRSDLFSLGVTLYQMLSGELPFLGDSMANLMYKITNEKHMDIRILRPDLPLCITSIINKALNKDIEKRFQSGKQMVTSIKRCSNKLSDTLN